MYLLEYGGIRYLFLLRYNKETAFSEENELLEKIHEAVEDRGDSCLKELMKKCSGLFWPFLKADYESREGNHKDASTSVR